MPRFHSDSGHPSEMPALNARNVRFPYPATSRRFCSAPRLRRFSSRMHLQPPLPGTLPADDVPSLMQDSDLLSSVPSLCLFHLDFFEIYTIKNMRPALFCQPIFERLFICSRNCGRAAIPSCVTGFTHFPVRVYHSSKARRSSSSV